jgi:hypothetical protein
MIKIRYGSLPEGLHARAVELGRHTVIYFRPGLSLAERREGLRRARQTARMGYGPRLPAIGVRSAVAADRVRITIGNVAAAVRHRPGSSALLAGLLAAGLACYMLFGPVPVTFMHTPLGLPQPQLGQAALLPQAAPGGGQAGQRRTRPGASSHRTGYPGYPAAGTLPTPGSPVPSPATDGSPTARPASPSPSPSGPSPSPSQSQLCLAVGPLGVCLPL